MNKKIIIKIAIIIVVLIASYGGFWFFTTSQAEKKIQKFVSENSSNINVAEFSVSGFPMLQKIVLKDVKFTIPNQLLNKKTVIVKEISLKSGIFSSDFIVNIDQVSLQDNEGNVANVEFSKDPEISLSINNDMIGKVNYQDSGYRITDSSKNIIYSSSSSSLAIESSKDESNKITIKITANIKEIEGYGLAELYKYGIEEKIIEKIKTEGFKLQDKQIVAESSQDPLNPANPLVEQNASSQTQEAVPASQQAVDNPSPAPNNPNEPSDAQNIKTAEIPSTINDTTIVKSNFVLDLEYSLTPSENNDGNNQDSPKTATSENAPQSPEVPALDSENQNIQYVKTFKINNLEFSNPLYRINLGGELKNLVDDSYLSGGLSIKIDRFDSLLSQLTNLFTQLHNQRKEESSKNESKLEAPYSQIYSDFLDRVSKNIIVVAKEIASKNAVTKAEIAEFDIRREKNLDFVINETSIREILEKF